MKPILLLDVDGVLCPWGTEHPGRDYEEYFYTYDSGAGDSDWVSPTNGQYIRDLTKLYEVVWCTARDVDVLYTIAPAHVLPAFEVIEFGTGRLPGVKGRSAITLPIGPPGKGYRADTFRPGTWKLPWVNEWTLQSPRPVAWLDDELHDDARDWARNREAIGLPTLLIQPASDVGLLEDHITALVEWCEQLDPA